MQARVKGSAPELPFAAYTGIYKNDLFGTIHITAASNSLNVAFDKHVNVSANLQFMDNGEWMLTYRNASYGIFPLKFKIANGKVVSAEFKVNDELEYDPYLFTKAIQ
jgi:hypothetical protein